MSPVKTCFKVFRGRTIFNYLSLLKIRKTRSGFFLLACRCNPALEGRNERGLGRDRFGKLADYIPF